MPKAYIAFSIHGTNTFIVAVHDKLNLDKLPQEFTKVDSRRDNHDPVNDGQKLHWSGLISKTTGKPFKSPPTVLNRFSKLQAMGFTIIGRKEFTQKHFRNKK